MNSSIFWKLLLTAVVLVWAIMSMMPISDTPFEQYIETRANYKRDEFKAIIAEAQKRVDPINYKNDPDKSSTLYMAIGEYANQNKIDLSQFFDVNVADIKILNKRNDVLLKELYRQSKASLKKGLDLVGGVSFTLAINKDELADDAFSRAGQIEDVIRVIDSRINALGVTEPSIRSLGGNSIEVQMPGVSLKDNPEAVEEISRPAKLEFRLAHRSILPLSPHAPKSEWPIGYELLTEETERNGQLVETALYVKRRAEAGGDIIQRSGVRMDERGAYTVAMDFTPQGASVIHQITSKILAEDGQYAGSSNEYERKQRMAIVLDGKLISAPSIINALKEHGQITGNFSQREAIELANALNNPLKVGLTRTSMNEVGPSMASDARDSSLTAGLIGASLVFLFMVLYYRGMGFLAMLTVAANITIVIGVLASFGATMTLPGIAALVLTVGMAVDANILIFERMREELLLGKSQWNALEAGYEKAFSTIVDANVTTLFTAVILWQFGAGPVKGFGVTLAVGILATLFCALVFGRALSEIAVKFGMFKNSFNFRLIGETDYDIFKARKLSLIVSWAVIIAGIFAIWHQGDKILSIDFTGGENTSISFVQKIDLKDINELSLANPNLGEIQASYRRDLATGVELLNIQSESDKGDLIFAALVKKFPEAGLKMVGHESIGAAVSSSITINAFVSLGLAFLVMLLYIALRFEIGFGVGAIVALAHDMFMTISLYIIFGMFGIGSGQFSSPMIAAILMTVGYSINDKIVVFDRIREELPLHPQMSLYDIIRLAINKTFSRTILTSLTTFFAAFALFLWGTGIIKDFSFIFMIGIIIGTFSSIFIASPVFYWWHKGKRKSVEEHELEVKPSWNEE